jgi:hypothetical protein
MWTPMFNVKFTKECMSILFLSDPIFHLWEMILVEWEDCNILDKTRDVPTCLPMPIEKSTFGYLSNLKEKQLEKLVRGLFMKTITIRDRPMKGRGRPDLKSIPLASQLSNL